MPDKSRRLDLVNKSLLFKCDLTKIGPGKIKLSFADNPVLYVKKNGMIVDKLFWINQLYNSSNTNIYTNCCGCILYILNQLPKYRRINYINLATKHRKIIYKLIFKNQWYEAKYEISIFPLNVDVNSYYVNRIELSYIKVEYIVENILLLYKICNVSINKICDTLSVYTHSPFVAIIFTVYWELCNKYNDGHRQKINIHPDFYMYNFLDEFRPYKCDVVTFNQEKSSKGFLSYFSTQYQNGLNAKLQYMWSRQYLSDIDINVQIALFYICIKDGHLKENKAFNLCFNLLPLYLQLQVLMIASNISEDQIPIADDFKKARIYILKWRHYGDLLFD